MLITDELAAKIKSQAKAAIVAGAIVFQMQAIAGGDKEETADKFLKVAEGMADHVVQNVRDA